jgi:hypothetical protein
MDSGANIPLVGLVDQILDNMFERLKDYEEFDQPCLAALHSLREAGSLKKPAEIIRIVRAVKDGAA